MKSCRLLLALYGMVSPSAISKEGLKLSTFFVLDIVDISFVNVALETGRHHSSLSDASKL